MDVYTEKELIDVLKEICFELKLLKDEINQIRLFLQDKCND